MGMKQVKARYCGGALVPLDALDLDEGEVVELAVVRSSRDEASLEQRRERFLATAGGFKDWEYWEAFRDQIYENRSPRARP